MMYVLDTNVVSELRKVRLGKADAQGLACGHCDACRLRAAGFIDAGVADPTRYAR